jgi:hypothetical protein
VSLREKEIMALEATLARERFARQAVDQALSDAIAERDEARAEAERLRAENRKLHAAMHGERLDPLTAEVARLRELLSDTMILWVPEDDSWYAKIKEELGDG